MKFNNTGADYSSTVGSTGKTMGFAPEAQSFLMDMMSDGLYSDKYGSIVREIASNCIDANTESGSDEPVRIVLTRPSSFTAKGEIRFEDCGVGIDPQRIEDIFTLYFASTKRDGNDMIGGFGIGAKSPFAYTNVFRVETWCNGTFYTYLMEKRGEDRTCTLISSEPCDVAEHGTKIRIPIQDTFDYEKFVDAVNEQTLLMRPIAVELDGKEYEAADVYEFENFYVVYDRNGDHVTGKIALGNVVYPLDTTEYFQGGVYQKPTVIPKLEIGTVMPTMSRESLQLNDEAKAVIQAKVNECLVDLQAMADSQVEEIDDLRTVLQTQDFKSLEIKGSERRIDMTWATARYSHGGNGACVKLKANVWSKFPSAPVQDIGYYGLRILTPYKELSQGRNYGSGHTFKSANLSNTGIRAALGLERANRWDAPEMVVRMPKDIKMTAADKDYILENYGSKRILFIKSQDLDGVMTFEKLAKACGYEPLRDEAGELMEGYAQGITDFLFDAIGRDVMQVIMNNTMHWDEVKATAEYIVERKEAMKAARQNVTKKERANDHVRVRGLGVHYTEDMTLARMLKRQKDEKRGYVYCTKADIDIMKQTQKETPGMTYMDFTEYVKEYYEQNNVWFVAVNAKAAKQFKELDVFTSFADYIVRRDARNNNDLANFLGYMNSLAYENRLFLDNFAAGNADFGKQYEALRKLQKDLVARGIVAANGKESYPTTYQIMGSNVGVGFINKALKLADKMKEDRPFLHYAFINVKTYTDNYKAICAEAVNYMFLNRA